MAKVGRHVHKIKPNVGKTQQLRLININTKHPIVDYIDAMLVNFSLLVFIFIKNIFQFYATYILFVEYVTLSNSTKLNL